jgi:hypothetical protein
MSIGFFNSALRSFLKLHFFGKRENEITHKTEIKCARDWIRTSTFLRTLPPEGSASTNFATRAFKNQLSISQ